MTLLQAKTVDFFVRMVSHELCPVIMILCGLCQLLIGKRSFKSG